jgi:hypothetical protein
VTTVTTPALSSRSRQTTPVPSDFTAALAAIKNAGVALALTDEGKIRATPTSAVTDYVKAIVAAHRPALVEGLRDMPRFGSLVGNESVRCVFCDEQPCSCVPGDPSGLPGVETMADRTMRRTANLPGSSSRLARGRLDAAADTRTGRKRLTGAGEGREGDSDDADEETENALSAFSASSFTPAQGAAGEATGPTAAPLPPREPVYLAPCPIPPFSEEEDAVLFAASRECSASWRERDQAAIDILMSDLAADVLPEWIVIPGQQANGRADLASGRDPINRERSTCGPRRYLRNLLHGLAGRPYTSDKATHRDVISLAFWWQCYCRTYGKPEPVIEAVATGVETEEEA